MQTIPHRELRNRSAEILRRVREGESYTVTNNGRPVAILSPVPQSRLEGMLASGLARAAASRELPRIVRVKATVDSQTILDDLRGDR